MNSERLLPQVNASLAARMLAAQKADDDEPDAAAAEALPGKRPKRPAGDLLQDDRFKALFEDQAFTIDEQSEEYRALHPNAGAPAFYSSQPQAQQSAVPPHSMPTWQVALMWPCL